MDWLVQEIIARHGLVTNRRLPAGSERPYELNITYASALSDPEDATVGRRRFLCSQAVTLAMQGIPAIISPVSWARLTIFQAWKIEDMLALSIGKNGTKPNSTPCWNGAKMMPR